MCKIIKIIYHLKDGSHSILVLYLEEALHHLANCLDVYGESLLSYTVIPMDPNTFEHYNYSNMFNRVEENNTYIITGCDTLNGLLGTLEYCKDFETAVVLLKTMHKYLQFRDLTIEKMQHSLQK